MKYEDPLVTRYASTDMAEIFSEKEKVIRWRKLWIALAEAEKELGLNIIERQIREMRNFAEDLNPEAAAEREKVVRHDVAAEIYAYGQQCPLAKPIIHLGATSCYVKDNGELISYYKALFLIKQKIVAAIARLRDFAAKHADTPVPGYTHLQSAQPVTAGKRATLWIQDLLFDYHTVDGILRNYRLRGAKGATGTQASFGDLFDGDYDKVKALDKAVCEKLGFGGSFAVTGQTYPRKFDYVLLSALSEVAQSAMKFGNDIRILQAMGEMEEPFGVSQIGSSAMAYKRNPIRAERLCSLSRYLLTLPENAAMTAGSQFLERTLDDSANRRIVMPAAFMAADGVLGLYINIASNMTLFETVAARHVNEALPFIATENVLMECVKAGGDRQKLHEKLRGYSMHAAESVKRGGKNDLLKMIIADEDFKPAADILDSILQAKNFIGFAAEQVTEFIRDEVDPVLEANPEAARIISEINV